MKQKLFENVSGNQFKLITESIGSNSKTSMVREGLKKVFSAGSKELSYKRIGNVGLGYIKDVTEARKCAIQEARGLALEYGYMDNENNQAFVKSEEKNPESDMSNPEESREVQIGKEIVTLCQGTDANLPEIMELANELIALHTDKATTKPGTGGASYKAGSIY